MRVVLISPYDLGRQPFALAHLTAHLRQAGIDPVCVDLSCQTLSEHMLRDADCVAVHLGMHTATRLALKIAPRIRKFAPNARTCAFGLYAKMNEEILRQSNFETTIDGEYEEDLAAWVLGHSPPQRDGPGRIEYKVPARDQLPPLADYAKLLDDNKDEIRVGFVTASRGCKHTCRHCPVVPVYQGKFRAVPLEIVMADIQAQVEAGAEHIGFGDPDFLNGPRHALRIANALAARWPQLTWDCVIKIEHLLRHRDLLPQLREAGLLFVTSAVESVDDQVLEFFDKGHTVADFERAVRLMREVGIGLCPTFVPFTPWTTIDGYLNLLRHLVELDLHGAVAPVQLAIRLLVPRGSLLLKLEGFRRRIGPFDPHLLGFQWTHDDPGVDDLQRDVCAAVGDGAGFAEVWALAHRAAEIPETPLPTSRYRVPSMSEPWYCCAEPTENQLVRL